jgi:hypothetical protein
MKYTVLLQMIEGLVQIGIEEMVAIGRSKTSNSLQSYM